MGYSWFVMENELNFHLRRLEQLATLRGACVMRMRRFHQERVNLLRRKLS